MFKTTIAILSIGVMLVLIQLFSTGLIEGDGLYHYRHAALIMSQGLGEVTHFPWLVHSTVSLYGADLWWGFHLIIMLFLWIGVVSQKTIIIVIGVTVITTFYWFLRRLQVSYPELWTSILVLGSADLLIRLSVLRPQVVIIGLFILALYCIIEKKYWILVPICVVWVTVELSVVMIFVPVVAYGVLVDQNVSRGLRLVLFPLVGILLGLIIHPAFPQNVGLMLIQYQALLLPLKGVFLDIGNELRPYNFKTLLQNNMLVMVPWVLALSIIVKKRFFADKQILYLAVVSLVLFLGTLRVQRFMDFWIPSALIVCSSVFSRWKWKKVVLVIVIALTVIMGFRNGLYAVRLFIIPVNSYHALGQYLNQQQVRGQTILNLRWEQFPYLWYFSPANYYVAGMDPTFMYLYDQSTYREWSQLSKDNVTGLTPGKLRWLMGSKFNTNYIIMSSKTNFQLQKAMQSKQFSDYFEMVWDNTDLSLYRLR